MILLPKGRCIMMYRLGGMPEAGKEECLNKSCNIPDLSMGKSSREGGNEKIPLKMAKYSL